MKQNISTLIILTVCAFLSCRDQKTALPKRAIVKKDSMSSIDWEVTSVKSDDDEANMGDDSLPQRIEQQFPKEYTLLKYASGDLNKAQ